jgi:hypothetical protein
LQVADAAALLSYKEKESRLSAQSAHDVAVADADTQISKATALHSTLLHRLSVEAHREAGGDDDKSDELERFGTVLAGLKHTAAALVERRAGAWDSVGVSAASQRAEFRKAIADQVAGMDRSIKAQHQEVERYVHSQK